MIGLVFVTHGNLALEFLAAMEHVVGKQDRVACVCIGPEDDMEAAATTAATLTSYEKFTADGRRLMTADATDEQLDNAIDLFGRAVSEYPGYADAYLARAQACLMKDESSDNFARVLKDYRKYQDLKPSLIDGYLGEAEVQIRDTNTDDAIAVLEKAIDAVTDPTDNAKLKKRLEEVESGNYNDSEGRVRCAKVLDGEGKVYETICYDRYTKGSDKAAIIRTYDANGSQIGTSFSLYADTEKYVYGFIHTDTTWDVYIPLYDDSGRMIGTQIYTADKLDGYEMYTFSSDGNQTGVERYDSEKKYIEYVSYNDPVPGPGKKIGVSGTAHYTLEEVYTLVKSII
jgi:tetratricopeptide (TPR) repeat protein